MGARLVSFGSGSRFRTGEELTSKEGALFVGWDSASTARDVAMIHPAGGRGTARRSRIASGGEAGRSRRPGELPGATAAWITLLAINSGGSHPGQSSTIAGTGNTGSPSVGNTGGTGGTAGTAQLSNVCWLDERAAVAVGL